MDAASMPIIRIELNHLKTSIIHHLGAFGSELGQAIDAQIERAIEEYPFEAQVTRIVHEAISSEIEGYFKYGEGAKGIAFAIGKSLEEIFKNMSSKTVHIDHKDCG